MKLKKLAELLYEDDTYVEVYIEYEDTSYNVSMYEDVLLIIKDKDSNSFWSKSIDEIDEFEELREVL